MHRARRWCVRDQPRLIASVGASVNQRGEALTVADGAARPGEEPHGVPRAGPRSLELAQRGEALAEPHHALGVGPVAPQLAPAPFALLARLEFGDVGLHRLLARSGDRPAAVGDGDLGSGALVHGGHLAPSSLHTGRAKRARTDTEEPTNALPGRLVYFLKLPFSVAIFGASEAQIRLSVRSGPKRMKALAPSQLKPLMALVEQHPAQTIVKYPFRIIAQLLPRHGFEPTLSGSPKPCRIP